MKKNIVMALFMIAFVLSSRSQITLEHNYPASAGLTELSLSGFKYFGMNVINNQCEIFNLDHTPWKTIPLDVPDGMYLYDVRYVSESLFNDDNKVELVYIYYSYDTTLYYYTYYCKIIDETGMELLSIPGCAYVEVKLAGDDDYKLLAYVYDYSIINWTLNTYVYSLPGTLPASGVKVEGEDGNRRPYPNPSSSRVIVPYELPEGEVDACFEMVSLTGQVVRNVRINCSDHELVIQTAGIPSGTYIYRIKTDSGILDSGKLIFR